ncbi:ASPM [Symbiodinium sp. CCMP2592]|nr:ASPM [Symbiodinium sp. CCMP2592]
MASGAGVPRALLFFFLVPAYLPVPYLAQPVTPPFRDDFGGMPRCGQARPVQLAAWLDGPGDESPIAHPDGTAAILVFETPPLPGYVYPIDGSAPLAQTQRRVGQEEDGSWICRRDLSELRVHADRKEAVENAALKIQSTFRGCRGRKTHRKLRTEHDLIFNSAAKLQAKKAADEKAADAQKVPYVGWGHVPWRSSRATV